MHRGLSLPVGRGVAAARGRQRAAAVAARAQYRCVCGCVIRGRVVAFEFSIVPPLQLTLFCALSGSLVERADARLSMSLRACGSSDVTYVVTIGCSCSLLDV